MFMGCQTTQNVDLLKDELPEASRDVSAEETKNDNLNSKKQLSNDPIETKKSEANLSNDDEERKDIISYLADFFKKDDTEKKKNVNEENFYNEAPNSQIIVSKEESSNFLKPDTQDDGKRIIPLSLLDKIEKAEESQSEDNFYKPEKPKDEKRILSFFTGFFEDKESKNKKGVDDEQIIVSKKEKQFKNREKPNKSNVIQSEENKSENIFIEQNKNLDKEPVFKMNDNQVSIKGSESYDNQMQNEVSKESNETISQDNEKIAFFDLKKSDVPKDKIKQPKNNFIGLLLPLTGEKRSAGNLVLNTFRYSLIRKPMNINFKIYDTKGTKEGAVDAARKGKRDGVEIFVGPIFSDETKALKNYFGSERSLTFFSLSPDLSNVSENIIVSGQNPVDQMMCIADDINKKDINQILLIYHNDRYGEIIRNSFLQALKNKNKFNDLDVSFLEVTESLDLNKEIKSISQFEKRKRKLKNKKIQISKDKVMPIAEKQKELKRLDRLLTLSVPFDSVIVASAGDRLLEILSHLAFYDINSNNTRIYGTSLWEDTEKSDYVFENTYFVTNLKNKSKLFSKNFKDVFSKEPSSVNFHLIDLIDLVNEFKYYKDYPENKLHVGEFTNSSIKLGSLKRETFLKKNKRNSKIEDISSCRLDAL